MADEEAGAPKRPEKVSKDELANEIVELLRQAAHKIIELDNKCARTENELVDVRRRFAVLEENYVQLTEYGEVHEAWEGLLLDFRSGIRDKDELLTGTVGR
jgi:hypothetical protein